MSAEEVTPLDERCASLLADCHDALLAGEPRSTLARPDVPLELRARLERDLTWARLLDQAWSPRPCSGPASAVQAGARPAASGASELPTSIGRFQIRRELGRGGYGIVFQAFDPQLGRDVALKVPRPEAVLTPALRERFLREAKAAAVLDHPNLVPVYDAGEMGLVCYIASAYCPGTNLDAWLKTQSEPVPWPEAAALVATLAEAVDHAHANRVVHRDLKPSNILLGTESKVLNTESQVAPGKLSTQHSALSTFVPRITDFGLAKFHSLDAGTAAPEYPTQSGAIVGTPRYMAPEQAVGSSLAVGPAADIHALGAILYEVLTGRPPFVAETVLDILEQVRSHDPLPPGRLRPKLPRDLETICLRCLQKEPGKRYASAGELAEDLHRFLAGRPILARPVGTWERAVKWARRRPAAAALVAVSSLASLLLVVGLAVGLVVISDKQQQTEDAFKREKQALAEMEQTSYLNGITSALHELLAGNWGRGEEFLQQCPQKLRGWEWHYLKRLRHTPPISPLPVGERITMSGGGFDLAFHPNGRLLAVPSSDSRIRVWDTLTGVEAFRVRGHTGRVLGLAFSPDGQRLASTSEDKTVKVWDVSAFVARASAAVARSPDRATSVELQVPVFTCGFSEQVIAVAFSPDGQYLASASGETDKPGKVKVWDAGSGKELLCVGGQAVPNPLVHLAFSPDSRRIASPGLGNTVKVWEISTGRELFTLSGHTAPILHVTFTPDGHRLIAAGRDRLVNIWDLPPGDPVRKLTPRWTLRDFSTSVWCLALSPDGSRLAVGGPRADGNVRVYDMRSERLLHTLMGDNRVVSVAFSPDGRRLASAGSERIVRLWDTTTGQEVLSLRGHEGSIGRVLFSPDGQRLASASSDGRVRIWDAASFDENADPRIRTLGGQDDGEFNGVAFAPDGRRLASASSDKSIKLWDIQTGEVVRAFHGHEEAALCVAFSPDGRHLLSGSMDRTVKLWDAQTGEQLPLAGCDRFELLVNSVTFSPDGRTFAAGAHQEVRVRDLTGQALLPPLQADPEFVSCVAFSRDGKHLATVGHTGIAKIWDVTSGITVCSFKSPQENAVAFHPAGKYAASGGSDGTVRLWEPATGQEIHRALSGHIGPVQSVGFSPDGRHLASASLGEVIVWDTNDFKRLQTFDRLAGRIWSVAFSPDGKRLAAATGYKGKGEIKIWDAALWESDRELRRQP
jgi:WD40 repeat protein/serine/threonine protein kinase